MPLRKIALTLPFGMFLILYGAAIGHGFISDDFAWILDSRVQHVHDIASLFFKSSGFYRPVVGLTFALDYAMFGVHPLGYGLTNLLLAVGCALLLFLVARELGLPSAGAALAAALWLLNTHGINTAIIWMSGRTSLLLTLGSLAAVLLLLRGHPFLSLLPAAVALFSKEEAFLLPVILWLWWIVFRGSELPRRRVLVSWWICALLLIGAYLVLRFQTGAMTPWTAPPYYRFTANPHTIARNIFEYADRAMTFPAAAAILAWILLRPRSLDPPPKAVLGCGAAWIAGGYGLTVFLPVRSSLYACFPCAGACLIAADFASRCWTGSTPVRKNLAAVAAIVVTFAMTPVYILRNRTTIANAEFSSWALRKLASSTTDLPSGSAVVVLDDRHKKPNIETAFNTALDDAFELTSGRRLLFWVEPELQYARLAGMRPPCASCAAATVDLRRQ
ncbi:MAG: hypothetical protein ACRD1V_18700 [Vicinamibacterales bacterium]